MTTASPPPTDAPRQIEIAPAIQLREELIAARKSETHWKERALILAQLMADLEASIPAKIEEALTAAQEAKRKAN